MPRVIDDPDRPQCPNCMKRTWVNNHNGKVQRYYCPRCNVYGTAAEFRENRLKRRGPYRKHTQTTVSDLDYYEDPAADPDGPPDEPECYACELYPASRNGAGLCSRCLAKLSRARFAARQMPEAEKQVLASRARIAFETYGYVRLRPLTLKMRDDHPLRRGLLEKTHAV